MTRFTIVLIRPDPINDGEYGDPAEVEELIKYVRSLPGYRWDNIEESVLARIHFESEKENYQEKAERIVNRITQEWTDATLICEEDSPQHF